MKKIEEFLNMSFWIGFFIGGTIVGLVISFQL